LTKAPIWVEFHTQLFVGPEGSGTLPMAIPITFCGNQNGENGTNQSCNLKFQKYHILIYFVYPTVTTEEVKKKPKVLISLLTGDNS
jgi:DNA polymerase-3 subunit delta'